jgi:opacity protein-like surface antigen
VKQRFLMMLAVVMLVGAVGTAEAAGGRPDKDWKSFFGHVAGGLNLAQGDFGDIVDDDIYLNGGFMYWPQEWPIGLNVDLAWTESDIKSSVIRRINDALPPDAGLVNDGEVSIWSLSVNGQWGPDLGGPVGLYVTAGIGIDWLDAELTDDALVYYPPVCDPWFWWCVPGGVGPGTVVRADEDATEFGWNAGLGITFDLDSGSQIFVEARYKTTQTDREDTEYVPVVVGFRW